MRWHSRLSSLQNAASSSTYGALDIQRATGLRNMPDLTEKNAINTFLLFSPSLSPDLFMFLDLCLHCLAFIRGDGGCCSAGINGISSIYHVRKDIWRCNLWCYRSQSTFVNMFSVRCLFVERLSQEMQKAMGLELHIPECTCAGGGSSFGTL